SFFSPFNPPSPTPLYTLSLHDALPIYKIPELRQALEGRVTAHHRFLLRELLDHLYFVESKMQRIEQEVAERLGPFQSEVARLCTDRKSTRLNSSHVSISYAVFCLKKKK